MVSATIKSTSKPNHVLLAININRMIYHVHMPLLLYYVLTIYSLLSFYHNFVQFKPGKIPTLQIFILLYSVRMYHHQNLIPIQRKNLHAMPLALAYLGDDLRRSAIDVVKLTSMPQELKIYMRSAWSQLTHMSDASWLSWSRIYCSLPILTRHFFLSVRCISVLLYFCIVVFLYCCIAVFLYFYISVLLWSPWCRCGIIELFASGVVHIYWERFYPCRWKPSKVSSSRLPRPL